MKGEIVLKDVLDKFDEEFDFGIGTLDFSFSIYVGNKPFVEQLKNKETFKQCMENVKKFRNTFEIMSEKDIKEIEYVENNFDNILDSVEYIVLNFEKTDIKEFISKNPIVLTKKIVLLEQLDITDYDKLNNIYNSYKDIANNIYVMLYGNYNYVSLSDCYKIMNSIKEKASNVLKLNLSPMEKIMYVYDEVRDRVYKKEDDGELIFKSRDLNDILFGDKIVCVGYANIFNAILKYSGIESLKVLLSEPDGDGHVRNMIYVKDDKYNIDGVYYFDATWDSKRESDVNNTYLCNYKYFAKTRKYMDDDKNFNFEDDLLPDYSDNIYDKIKYMLENNEIKELIPYIKSINYMSRVVTKENIISSDEITNIYKLALTDDIKVNKCYEKMTKKVIRDFKDISDKFKKELPAEVMIELFNNVRKVEYYLNPDKYPYSLDSIYKTYLLSGWKFNKNSLTQQQLLLLAIFGEETCKRNPKEEFINYVKENEVTNKIEQVKLTKVLQKTLDKKRKNLSN